MFLTKILQLTDKNLHNFKHWGCDFNCVKSACSGKNNNPVCYILYSQVSIYLYT